MSRGTRVRSRGLPAWHKGQLLNDDIDDFWYGDREGKLFKRRGLLVSKKNYDVVTDKEREEQIQRILSNDRKRRVIR